VSTDDVEIAKIASDYGALVPFLRPKELAQDNSSITDCIDHFLAWFINEKKFIPNFLILFLPTTPFRDVNLINEAIIKINFNPDATSLRSVEEIADNPHKWFKLEKDYLYPLLDDDFDLHYKPRQQIPKVYKPNGYIDIIKLDTLLNYDSLYGRRILPFITPHTVDIDTIDDFKYASYLLKKNEV
jgi:CMP-N-acetylneuraminic acid synthetase